MSKGTRIRSVRIEDDVVARLMRAFPGYTLSEIIRTLIEEYLEEETFVKEVLEA